MRQDSRSHDFFHFLLHALSHDFPSLVQEPPTKRELFPLDVFAHAVFLAFLRDRLCLVQSGFEVFIVRQGRFVDCLSLSLRVNPSRESCRACRRRGSRGKGVDERFDVVSPTEEGELNVSLQREQ